MKSTISTKVLTFSIFSFMSAAFADDFKTLNGKEYKEAIISRVEPDGIVVKTKSGITKVYFTELPKDVQERFHYDSEKAASYSGEQAANYAAYQKQQEESRRQQTDGEAKKTAILTEQQTAQNRAQALQDRYVALQQEEDVLLQRIGSAKQPGSGYWVGKTLHHHSNPQRSQLPLFESHLSDVRHEKAEVRKQLEKTQH
jgi:hypothetical protein